MRLIAAIILMPTILCMQDAGVQDMPADIIQVIAHEVCDSIGNHVLINPKDLPVILKHIKRLALSNKRLYTILSSSSSNEGLITALARRFAISPLEVVEKLSTPSAQAWANEYVINSQDYKQFQILQKLLTLIRQIKLQLHKERILNVPENYLEYYKSISFSANKLKIILSIGELCAEHIYTPWGVVTIPDVTGLKSIYIPTVFLQELFKYIDVVFINLPQKNASPSKVVGKEIIKKLKFFPIQDADDWSEVTLLKDATQTLTAQDLDNKKVKNKIIVLNGKKTLYKVIAVEDQLSVDKESRGWLSSRTMNMLSLLWHKMELLYKQSQTGVMCNMYNPRPVIEEASKLCANCENSHLDNAIACTLCRKTFYCSQECQNADVQNHKLLCTCLEVKKLNDIPKSILYLVGELEKQPIFNFTNKDKLYEKLLIDYYQHVTLIERDDAQFKLLLLNNRNEHQLCRYMHACGSRVTRGDIPYIVRDFDYSPLQQGICVKVVDNARLDNISALESAYWQVLQDIKTGWKLTRLTDYPRIYDKQSEEEWLLFIKTANTYPDQLELINCLIHKFDMTDKIVCSKTWDLETGGLGWSSDSNTYMWIRKDALEEFKQVFNFDLK